VNRYFSYCRKSTDDEDHQVLSIESQRQELKRYAEQEKLQIIESREEARSAKSPGRPIFTELLDRIVRGDADGILAWHPDRLARNALDGGQIIHLLDTGKLQNLKFPTYTFENTSQGKFMLAIMFGQSKYYVDSLSENVRRGNRTKRERGWFPGLAPMGYVNGRADTGEKVILPDPARFPIMKRLWELLLSGGFSVPQLLEIATKEMGLRTPKRRRIGGCPLSVSGIYRIFSNPFYAGQLVHDHQSYQGKHQPMVTMAQFQRAQELVGRADRARPKGHVFAYTGLMQCGSCGGSITAERKINRFGSRYVYYHCTHKKARLACREKCLEERQLEEQVLGFLKNIYLNGNEVEKALAAVDEERKKQHNSDGGTKRSVERVLENSVRNIDNLTKLRYRELIEEEEFIRQRSELNREEMALKERLQELGSENWIEPSQKLFLFSNRAVFWLTHGTIAEKRLILSTVGSNLVVKAKKLNIHVNEPFKLLEKRKSISTWCALVNDVRTFFLANSEFMIPALPEPDVSCLPM
jgi:site-specific DNA recombinase